MERESIVADMTARILAGLADPQTVNGAHDDGWKAALWRTLEENGLTLAWVPDELGGAGAEMSDGFAILGAAGAVALSVPLAETMLAGWLLAGAGLASPSGAMTVAPTRPDDDLEVAADGTLSGRAHAVPFAREARHLAVLARASGGLSILLVDIRDCAYIPGSNLAGDPLDDVVFDRVKPLVSAAATAGLDPQALLLMGCVVRAVQSAGALQSVLKRTVAYSGERIAFGKPIAKFQAVQGNVAQLAGEVAAATAAASSAADTMAHAEGWDDGVFLEAVSAKIRCAEAASLGSAIAHQVHGAIGLTLEHVLHRFTLRLASWSADFGSEAYWAVALGRRASALGGNGLWPLVASR